MTQDPARRSPSTYKRSARAGRNKPLLVTSTESEENESVGEDSLPTLEESLAEVQAQNPPLTSTTRATRRFAGFISNVGKKAPTDSAPEVDATQARLARATRSKGTKATTDTSVKSEQKAVAKKEPTRTTASGRPASPFKTKYFVGMAIYLLGANVVGIGVSTFFTNNHMDAILTQFSLFGGQIVIKTSTLVFLAILVILLVLLARFDLIPRSFSAMSGTPPPKRGATTPKSNQNTIEGNRTMPPTMKQGVKGKSDDLYQEYRANQRRDRKK